ncbi:hypothetical protein [Methylobacterium sp. J-070]|uniref:hypothetical protein n=1 Tax=Methylobacterium sp. J-070 TaxID=2836650 RepID=UPI001FBB6E1A|nr:hypothetical protein [Methylobacterium sp. J-070]MCJ2053868.1 hypothetical protein [Methylobacterium sp. J-070]
MGASSTLPASGTIRAGRGLRGLDLIGLALIFALALVVLAHDGILSSGITYSDETEHLRRTMIFARIWRGEFSLDLFATAYGGGIWPPLYPALMGALEAAFGLGVPGLRLVNVALVFAGFALFTRMIDDPRPRLLSLVIPACFLAGTTTYFQVRPENLAVLLVGLASTAIARGRLFRAAKPDRARPLAYAAVGALAGLTCLTHAVFALCAAYLTLLALLDIRRRWMFVAALLAVAGPYFAVQNSLHTGLVLFATTAEENLARNNNPYLRTAPRGEADDQLFAEMERRYADGDRVVYPRPLAVPASRYEQWLHDENKRRIFKAIALSEIAADPVGALRRLGERVVGLLVGDACLGDGRYGCIVSGTADRVAYAMLVALGLAGLFAAGRVERHHPRAVSFLVLCGVLLVPMVLTQGLVRHFVIVLLLGAYGGLFRTCETAREPSVAPGPDARQPA